MNSTSKLSLLFAILFATQCATMPASVPPWRAGLTMTRTAEGQQFAYLDAGPRTGAVVVLLHGLPTSSYVFREVVPALTSQGFRVVAPDLVGFGASSKPEDDSSYAIDLQAQRVLSLLDTLGVSSFSLVVHDLGGLVGWEMLGKQEERVQRLLVLNTTAYEGFKPPDQLKMLGGPLGGMMTSMLGGSLMGPGLTRSFIAENTGEPARIDDAIKQNVWWPLHEGATVPMRWMAKNFDTVSAAFPRYQASLRRFRGPAMVLWGTQDKVLGFDAIAQRFVDDLRVPAERVRRVASASHFVMIDHPDVVSAAILDLMTLPAP